jgi:tRNA G46 methylase TrmB
LRSCRPRRGRRRISGQVSKDSVWVPTPERMIRRMLQLADVTAEDLVVDVGAGDGRIPIYAARHFGARAIGVELEESLVVLATASANAQGVSHLARFVRQDLYDFDLSGATVIALCISPGVMSKLKPRLLGLKPGTRVVN